MLSDMDLVALFDAVRNPQPITADRPKSFDAILTMYCKPSKGDEQFCQVGKALCNGAVGKIATLLVHGKSMAGFLNCFLVRDLKSGHPVLFNRRLWGQCC